MSGHGKSPCTGEVNSYDMHFALERTRQILITAERGDKLGVQPNVDFHMGRAHDDGIVIEVFPAQRRQALLGIGTSMTEASAFVLAHLDRPSRQRVMRSIFAAEGADFTLARVPIGSCDFCVDGRYSYAPDLNDTALRSFSIACDDDGFDVSRFSGIKDPEFDLLPMIREAQAIKMGQGSEPLKIISSAWTAPPWMKDINDWFIPSSAANGYQGGGGALLPDHYSTYARYLDRYLSAYRGQGVDIWAITPVNEPLGNGGHWESMHFTPGSQNEFIKYHLGPCLQQGDNRDVQVLIYDHSRDQLEQWCDTIYGDVETSAFVVGAAVHWYESSFRVYEDVFDRVYARFTDKLIVHSEGCIDCLGVAAPEGVTDPEGYQECGWFDNDAFWWNDNATDYAYSATWPGIDASDHPKYTPVHRYARNIIVSLNHWVSAWIDWNIVLDQRGGPNHVGNFCGAPIMVDSERGYVYYTPVYYILAQLSRGLRPGAHVLRTSIRSNKQQRDTLYCCAAMNANNELWLHVLNTAKQPCSYDLQLGDQYASLHLPANALQSIQVRLGSVAV